MSTKICPQCHRGIPVHLEWGSHYCVDCGINVDEYWRVKDNQQQREQDQQPRQQREQAQINRQRQPQVTKQMTIARSSQLDSEGVPLELRRWSWPAFIFGWLWCFFNNLPGWGIASLVGWVLTWGFAGLIIDIILGASGNRYAWKAGHYINIQEYRRSQHSWEVATWIFISLVVFGVIVLAFWI